MVSSGSNDKSPTPGESNKSEQDRSKSPLPFLSIKSQSSLAKSTNSRLSGSPTRSDEDKSALALREMAQVNSHRTSSIGSSAESVDPVDDQTKDILFNKYGYAMEEKIGSGSYGMVFRATNQQLTDPKCAVKVIDTRHMDERTRSYFLPNELVALIELKHRSIVQIYDIFRHQSIVFIIMEYAGSGDLKGYLHVHRMISEPLVAIWFLQASEAVAYMHGRSIAHRDIKLDNLLLNDAYNVKLTDLGFAFFGTKEDVQTQILDIDHCGTLPYQAPELVSSSPYSPFMADIWALGVTLFALLTNKLPFHFDASDNSKNERMLSEMSLEKYPAFIRSRFAEHNSKAARNLVERMVNPNAVKRPLISQVLVHHFLTPPKVGEQTALDDEDNDPEGN